MKQGLSNYIVKNSNTKHGMFSKTGKVISQKQEVQFQQVERQLTENNKKSRTENDDENSKNAQYLNKQRKNLFNNFRIEFDDPKEMEIIKQQQKMGAQIPQRIGFIPKGLALKGQEIKSKQQQSSVNKNLQDNHFNKLNAEQQLDSQNPSNLKLFMEQKQRERALNKLMTQSLEPFTKQTSRDYREELKVGRNQNTRLGPQQYDPIYDQTERKLAKSIQDFKKIQTTSLKTQQTLEEKKKKIQTQDQIKQQEKENEKHYYLQKNFSKKKKKKKSNQKFETPQKKLNTSNNLLNTINQDSINLNLSNPNQELQEKILINQMNLQKKSSQKQQQNNNSSKNKNLDKSQDSEEFSLYQTKQQFVQFTASPKRLKNTQQSLIDSFYNKSFYNKTDYDIRDQAVIKKTNTGPQFYKRAGRLKHGSIYASGLDINENRFYLIPDSQFTNPRPKSMHYSIDKNLARERREANLQSKKVNVDFKYDITEDLTKKNCKTFKFEKYQPHVIQKNKETCLNKALNYYDYDNYQKKGSQVFKNYKCARASSVNYDKQKGRDEPSYYDITFNKPNYVCDGDFQTQRSNYLLQTSQKFYSTVQGPFTPKSAVKLNYNNNDDNQFSKTQFSFRKTSSTLNPQVSPKRRPASQFNTNGRKNSIINKNQNLTQNDQQVNQNQNQQFNNENQQQQYLNQSQQNGFNQNQDKSRQVPFLLKSGQNDNKDIIINNTIANQNQSDQKQFQEIDLELLPVKPRQLGIDLNDQNDQDFFEMDFRDFMVEKSAKSNNNKDKYYKNMENNSNKKNQELYQVLQMRNQYIDKKFQDIEQEKVKEHKNQMEQMFANTLY